MVSIRKLFEIVHFFNRSNEKNTLGFKRYYKGILYKSSSLPATMS